MIEKILVSTSSNNNTLNDNTKSVTRRKASIKGGTCNPNYHTIYSIYMFPSLRRS
jgi:hypothetical protein